MWKSRQYRALPQILGGTKIPVLQNKVQDLYKTWKSRTLTLAEQLMEETTV